MIRIFQGLLGLTLLSGLAFGGEHLKINPRLNYSSDSQDGPLITGEHMEDGAIQGKPNFVLMYGEG
ncbi:MAG TPA: hypothetical protein VNW97_19065 [Candidatus Saccharimonadales bacterium]|jgi:hypothetical protein|nr:hypothetical protein [Candidatus Saccharimonadales bacterium]